MAVKETNPLLGKPTIPPESRCAICQSTAKNGQTYEEFFTDAERKQLDEIAKNNPGLIDMLPPKNGKYLATSNPPATRARRDQWHKKKTKFKVEGEFHHPHQIQAGGCPFHQDVVKIKDPPDPAEQSVDTQVTKIVDGAVARARAA